MPTIGTAEKPYYGYRINTYITGALAGGGIAGIALAITFTVLIHSAWVLVSCCALGAIGAILLLSGLLWHLSIGCVNDPEKVKLLQDNFLYHLGTVWDGKGKVLDIGTGRGRAAIEIARQFPQAQVIGVDTWTRLWGFWGMTKAGAEENARIASLNDRCTFQNGNALDLPFKDGEFQLVVSAFVFHEVHVPDRTVLFEKVVRVLAPGGIFVICDLFPRGYKVKSVAELLKKVQELGVDNVEYKTASEAGVNLGGLARIWGIAYLSGRKRSDTSGGRTRVSNQRVKEPDGKTMLVNEVQSARRSARQRV
jgi:SAM-dependent methyltransferase